MHRWPARLNKISFLYSCLSSFPFVQTFAVTLYLDCDVDVERELGGLLLRLLGLIRRENHPSTSPTKTKTTSSRKANFRSILMTYPKKKYTRVLRITGNFVLRKELEFQLQIPVISCLFLKSQTHCRALKLIIKLHLKRK